MKIVSKQVITTLKSVVITTLKSVTVELNQEEIEFLRDVFNVIGGDPVHSRRRISARIRDTLESAGMNMNPVDNVDKEGSLFFLSPSDIENRKKTKIKSGKKTTIWDSRWEDECPF